MPRWEQEERDIEKRKEWLRKHYPIQGRLIKGEVKKISDLPPLERKLLCAQPSVDGKQYSTPQFIKYLSQPHKWSDTEMCLMLVSNVPERFKCFPHRDFHIKIRIDVPPECLQEFLESEIVTIKGLDIISNYDAKTKRKALEEFNNQKNSEDQPKYKKR